jgi:plastocyanin
MKPAVALTMVTAVLLAGGCGSSSSTKSTPASTPVTAAAPAPTSTRPAVTVTMRNITFIPQTVTVHVGQTIKWVNNDRDSATGQAVFHNVTADNNPQAFQSPTFGLGGSFTYTPKVAGNIPYVCTIHPNMTATLVVKP